MKLKEREMSALSLLAFSNELALTTGQIEWDSLVRTTLAEFFGANDFLIIGLEHLVAFNGQMTGPLPLSGGPFLFVPDKLDALGEKVIPPQWLLHPSGQLIGCPLRVNSELNGLLLVDPGEKMDIPKIAGDLEAFSVQVAVSYKLLVTAGKISRENEEKALLLTFSNDVASVRDKKGLSRIIKYHLKNHLLISDYLICALDRESGTHTNFLYDYESKLANNTEFLTLAGKSVNITDGIWDASLFSDEPRLFDVTELLSRENVPEYVMFWDKMGIRKVIGSSLRYGKEYLGVFWVDPKNITTELLKSISAHLAIAIANILANEKIDEQLKEINKYKQQLEEEKLYLQQEVSSGYSFGDIIGSGAEMTGIYEQMSQVAYAGSTVLIMGETGTGKELIARAIHEASPRKQKLMVKVNCAAIPENLIESELFGHEKGSFTGAAERRIGKFELANNGTLFLDEIGEMPLELQVKLLRALQEKEIERIGGKAVIKINVRIIAATNRDLLAEVKAGNFRADLYYRLNVFPITMPPLRDRKEDIPDLVRHFLQRYSRSTGRKVDGISNNVMKELMAYDWPGNVREMEHLLERSILVSKGSVIREVHLPVNGKKDHKPDTESSYIKTSEENERDHILYVLKKCNGRVFGRGGAAELLDMHISTLNSRIKKLGIRKEQVFTVETDPLNK